MDTPSPRLSLSLILATIVLAALGWAGVIWLATQTLPTVGPRWLFFAAWFTALTGTAIPFVHFLNKRFAHHLPPESTMIRQSIWVGIFGAACAWLQLGRALNWASFFLLFAALAAIEAFLLLRDRSKRPFDDPSTTAKR